MSRGTANKAKEHDAQPQLIFDAKRDINPFWRSSLFSDVYLKNDVPREYKDLWENDEIGDFYKFYQGFVDLCVETEHEAFDKWKEADTVKNWIVHVMDLLGWEYNSERRSNSYMDNESFTVIESGRKQTYRPDLLYFDKPKHKAYTQKEKDIDKKLLEARNKKTGTKIVVEAKYWDRLSHISEQSKKDAKVNDSASALGPELQTLKYMEIFDHEFGVLTDGKTWRLFHKNLSQGIDRRSFDFDLGNLRELALDLDSYQNEEKFRHYAKYFYYFFSKESLVHSEDSKTAPFVYEVFEYSKKYVHSIEDDLKERFMITMGLACNAIKTSCEENNINYDLELVRNVAESQLFNILFVKSCEVRRILPISSTQYVRVSLHEVIETMDAMEFDPSKDWDDYLRDFRFTFGKKFDWDGYEIYNRIINLFEIIHDGTAKTKDFGFEIEGFKESIFTKSEWSFAKKNKIKNRSMVNILFNLNFIESSFKGRKYQQIPYSYFTPRQLGSIYESFLEFRLEKASEDMIFKRGKWQKANIKSKSVKNLKLAKEYIVNSGELFFSPNNKDRKVTGAYYTPDHIVKFMIENTLGNELDKLSSEEILSLKICDPAMGSGHFLAGAMEYLVTEYRKKKSDELNDDLDEDVSLTARRILDSCIFGSDINERAVKLAKMSCWLTTASPGIKLEKLDDQLMAQNTLVGTSKSIWGREIKFDIVFGNPPYIGEKGNESIFHEVAKVELGERFYTRWMDYFYFFFHLGLDWVKDDGYVAFISTNYFFTSTGGVKLREDIKDRTSSSIFINFNELKIFKSAMGQHNVISILKRGDGPSEVKGITLEGKGECSPDFISKIDVNEFEKGDFEGDENYIRISSSVGDEGGFDSIFEKMKNKGKTLKQLNLDIMQGIVSGADKVTNNHLKKFPELKAKKDDGIFVLTLKQLKDMNLTKSEMDYVKPFYKNSDVNRFSVNEKNKYVTLFIKDYGEPIKLGKNLKKHFEKFEKLLTSIKSNFLKNKVAAPIVRKWLKNGNYFVMFNPKRPENYLKPKIVAPQRSKINNFGYTERPWYASADVYYITSKEDSVEIDLKYLLGLLNSKLFFSWLYYKGKRKGEALELYSKPLSEVPVKVSDKVLMGKIASCSSKLIKKFDDQKFEDLNQLIYELYELSKDEIDLIENLYNSRVVTTEKEEAKVA